MRKVYVMFELIKQCLPSEDLILFPLKSFTFVFVLHRIYLHIYIQYNIYIGALNVFIYIYLRSIFILRL